MQAQTPERDCDLGSHLLDSVALTKEQINILFAALLLTVTGVFLGGNLLLLDLHLLPETAPIAFTCLAVLLVFYTLASFLKSLAWGLVITYCMVWLVIFGSMQWFVPLFYVFAFFALIYTVRWLRVEFQELGLVVLMACIATTVILGCAATNTSFDMLQSLRAGHIHPDTLFHASIAAMIKNYGVTSTGLHGLIETPNHVLSHELMAGISKLSGVGVFEVYGIATQVLFSPILIFSVVACCAAINTKKSSIPLAWAIVCILLAVVPRLTGKWAFWDAYFVSESYLVALGLFSFGLVLLFKSKLNLPDIILTVILAALIANAKSTVGLIYFGLWLLRALFLHDGKLRLNLMMVCLVGLVVSLGTFRMVSAHAPTVIVPLDFISVYSYRGGNIAETMEHFFGSGVASWRWRSAVWAVLATFSFFIFHFLFSWIVVARIAYKNGWRALIKIPGSVFSLGAIGAGGLIIILFKIPGGSAGYFSTVAFFVSLPMVVFMCMNNYEKLNNKLNLNKKKAVHVVLSLVLFVTILMGLKTFKKTFSAHQLDAVQSNSLVDSLVGLRHQTSLDTYAHLNPTASINNPVKECWAQPFIYPALSERPWINIITSREDCSYQYYGYAEYGLNSEQKNVTVSPKLRPGMSGLSWPDSASIQSTPD